MKFFIRTYAPLVLTLLLVCLPLVTLAQNTVYPPGANTVYPPGANTVYPPGSQDSSSRTASCGGGTCSVENPLKVTNFCDLLRIVLDAILILGLPVAVVFLVLVGLKYIVARGNPDKIKDANKNFMWTVIGVAVFLGAWTIAQIIKETLKALGVTGFGSC